MLRNCTWIAKVRFPLYLLLLLLLLSKLFFALFIRIMNNAFATNSNGCNAMCVLTSCFHSSMCASIDLCWCFIQQQTIILPEIPRSIVSPTNYFCSHRHIIDLTTLLCFILKFVSFPSLNIVCWCFDMRFFFFSPFFPTFICKSILYRILMHRCAVNTVQRAHTIRFDAVFFSFSSHLAV